MASCIPIILSGNLGERHRTLNNLVRNVSINDSFHSITSQQDHSAIDRIFKIDIAVQQQNVDYIIQNLKDDDMLYVSRALKSKWLLEHRDIINPKYLEEILFPEMKKPAVTKFKHWLYINLRDASLAKDFYQFYKDNNFEFAIKFLAHCSNEFIINEFPAIISKISPHYLKVLTEKCPSVAKLFYDSLASNDEVVKLYLNSTFKYYESIKCLLKSDSKLFFDITERYFELWGFQKFNHSCTNYILTKHKQRFMEKPELYAAFILHLPTIAKHLNEEECEDLIIKLARARFLQLNIDYKLMEPLFKRLTPKKRTEIKKRVFVNKNIGELIEEWPYHKPTSPSPKDNQENAFQDHDFEPISLIPPFLGFEKALRKRKYAKFACKSAMAVGMSAMVCDQEFCESNCIRIKTELEKLFDECRFMGFEQTMHELGRRMGAAGSVERRRDIMLVLVSKSGGRVEHVDTFLQLCEQHANEPVHSRAAVVRSLVRRAQAWRLPHDTWQRLLTLGRGLGLDGTEPEVQCVEGLHAVVIRQFLANGNCDSRIRKTFLESFSTLTEYSLNSKEKIKIATALQHLLASSAMDAEPKEAVNLFDKFFDVLQAYRIRKSSFAIIEAVKLLAERDSDVSIPLLKRLYDMRIERRDLFRVNFKFKRDSQALVNALRHDPTAFNITDFVESLADSKDNFDQFFDKLTVYFSEKEGIADHVRIALKQKVDHDPVVALARPLASLLEFNHLETVIHELDRLKRLASKGDAKKCFRAALCANAHRARPSPNILALGWQFLGVKALATRLFCGRSKEANNLIIKLAHERRTARLALQLCKLAPLNTLDAFSIVAKNRPSAAIRGALLYMRTNGAECEQLWNIIKPLILNIDLSKREHLQDLLSHTDWIPLQIRPDHCAVLYMAFEKVSNANTDSVLQELAKLLPNACPDLVEDVLSRMLKMKKVESDKGEEVQQMPDIVYPALFIRYLLLSPTEDEQKRRLIKIGQPFLDRLDELRKRELELFLDFEGLALKQTIQSLKYNTAFLDPKYVSAQPVMEKINDWMQTFLLKEEKLEKYVEIHLTMLYHKAVRQCMKQMPEVFEDPKRKLIEGADAVAFIFGKYLAKDISELVAQYFDSIIELYISGIYEFFNEYNCGYYSVQKRFLMKLLEGFLHDSVGMQRRLVVYVMKRFRYNLEDDKVEQLKNMMKGDENISMFLNAELGY